MRSFFAKLSLAVLLAVTCSSALSRAAELRGRVIDARTGEPLPCRLYVQGSDGKWLFAKVEDPAGSAIPYDRTPSPTSFEQHTTLSAHPFVVQAPPGTTVISAELGKEYHRSTIKVESTEDAPQDFTLKLDRWIDMPARGWYSGDTHVHRTLEEVPNLMLAEDLHVAFPLTYWVRDAYQPADRGGPEVPPRPEPIYVTPRNVMWPINTEYELFTVNGMSHTEGAVFVLNHQKPLPIATPPVAPVADAAHSAGALLDLDKHSWNWSMMIVPIMNVDLFELANNHVWQTEFLYQQWTIEMLPADWDIEVNDQGMTEWGWLDFGFKTYYALLNCGFPMRPTGGTGNGVHPVPLGYGRVYVNVPGDFSYEKWIGGLDAGHSFVTTGPMLLVEFNDQLPGTKFSNTRTIHVRGSAESAAPLDRIEIIVNGEIACTLKPENEPTASHGFSSAINETLTLERSAWVAVRCFEPYQERRVRYAHTAPVHAEIDGPVCPRTKEVRYLITRMEEEIKRNRDVLRAEDIAEYEKALQIYRDIAKRAE